MQVLSICVYQTRWPNPPREMIQSCKCCLYVCIKPDGQTPLVKWYSHTSVFYMCVSNQMAKPPEWNDSVMQVLSICVDQTRWPNPLSEMIRSCKCCLYVCIKPDGQTPLVKWYSHASVFCVYQTRWPNPLSEMIRSCKCLLCVSNQMAKPP
jgi:hypothetical protein